MKKRNCLHESDKYSSDLVTSWQMQSINQLAKSFGSARWERERISEFRIDSLEARVCIKIHKSLSMKRESGRMMRSWNDSREWRKTLGKKMWKNEFNPQGIDHAAMWNVKCGKCSTFEFMNVKCWISCRLWKFSSFNFNFDMIIVLLCSTELTNDIFLHFPTSWWKIFQFPPRLLFFPFVYLHANRFYDSILIRNDISTFIKLLIKSISFVVSLFVFVSYHSPLCRFDFYSDFAIQSEN